MHIDIADASSMKRMALDECKDLAVFTDDGCGEVLEQFQ